jgi:DNA-binding beta-propeller fold protein YncE
MMHSSASATGLTRPDFCFVIIAKFSYISNNFMHLSRKTFSRLPSWVLLLAALTLLFSCSGNNGTYGGSTSTVSKFKKRLFALNYEAPSYLGLSTAMYIVNADNDLVFQAPLTIGSTDGYNLMTETPDKKMTLVFSSIRNELFLIDNATEAQVASLSTGGASESVVVLSDNKTALAAVRNVPVTNQPNGAVQLLDLTTPALTASISVPEVRRLAINHAGTKVLAFADDTNSLYVIDATAKTATAVPGFDRPVNAVFSTDDAKAYILNCGAECGGTTASVTVLNTSDNSLGSTVPVNGATVALLDGSKLYVAGSPNQVGQLDVIDTGSMTRTSSGVAITNGYHDRMALADGGKLYIGAHDCTIDNGKGCLSIFDTSGSTAVIPATSSPGNVTGLQPLVGRNLVYLSIGGEIVIFDTTTDAPRARDQLNVTGAAGEIRLID